MAKLTAEQKAQIKAKNAEDTAIDRALSPWLLDRRYNPHLVIGANRVAIDKEGHIYFLFSTMKKVDKCIDILGNYLDASCEAISAKMIIKDCKDSKYGIKVFVEKLSKLELNFLEYDNPYGFNVDKIELVEEYQHGF